MPKSDCTYDKTTVWKHGKTENGVKVQIHYSLGIHINRRLDFGCWNLSGGSVCTFSEKV